MFSLTAMFRFLGSRHILNVLLGFSTMTMELTQSVGSSAFLMTPLFSMSINAFFTLLRNVAVIFLGGFMTGLTELSI